MRGMWSGGLRQGIGMSVGFALGVIGAFGVSHPSVGKYAGTGAGGPAAILLAGDVKARKKGKATQRTGTQRKLRGVATTAGGTPKGFKGSDEELQALKRRKLRGASPAAGGATGGFKGSDEELQLK